MKDFKNKVVVITGAGSGLGRALALKLADHGAILALNDWNAAALSETKLLLQSKGTSVFTEIFDVRDREAHIKFAKEINSKYNRIDGLINNAGLSIYPSSIVDTSLNSFQRVIDVNLWGTIHGTQVFLPYLLKQDQAFLANICSVLGLVSLMGQGAYCTSKAAIRGFSESLYQE